MENKITWRSRVKIHILTRIVSQKKCVYLGSVNKLMNFFDQIIQRQKLSMTIPNIEILIIISLFKNLSNYEFHNIIIFNNISWMQKNEKLG